MDLESMALVLIGFALMFALGFSAGKDHEERDHKKQARARAAKSRAAKIHTVKTDEQDRDRAEPKRSNMSLEKRLLILLGLMLALSPLLPAQQAAKPNLQSRAAGGFIASQYVWEARTQTAVAVGSQTVTLFVGGIALPDGRTIYPFATTVPIKIDSGANQEIVTPSAVSGCNSANITSTCFVTATFTLAHSAGALIQSGTFGLQDAINDATLAGGGTVYVDSFWAARGGTSAMLTAMTQTASVAVADVRTSHMVVTSGVAKTVTNPY